MLTVIALRRCFAVVLILSSPGVSQASARGHVNMTGSIYESSCSIDTASANQITLLKTASLGQLIRDGEGESSSLKIKLVGCSTQLENHSFRITFYGAKGDNDTFHVLGNSKGIGIRIIDANGKRIRPNEPTFINQDMLKSNALEYTLKLTGNGDVLQPGVYAAIVRMNLDYY